MPFASHHKVQRKHMRTLAHCSAREHTVSTLRAHRIGVHGVSFIGSRDSQRAGSGGISARTTHRNSTTRARRPFVNKRLCFRTTAACCKTMSAHSTAARSGSKEHGHESCVALWSPLVSNMVQALRLRSCVMDMLCTMDVSAHQKQRFTQEQSFRCRECSKWSLMHEAMTKKRVEVM